MNLRSKLGLEVEYWLENSWWSIKLSMKGEVGCTWNGGGLPVTSQVSLVFGNVRHSIVCLHDWLVICCGIYHTTLIYPSMNCHNIQYKKNYKSKKLPHCCYCLWFYMEWHPPKQRIMRKCSMQSAHKRNSTCSKTYLYHTVEPTSSFSFCFIGHTYILLSSLLFNLRLNGIRYSVKNSTCSFYNLPLQHLMTFNFVSQYLL